MALTHWLVQGFLLGLSVAPTCLGSCLPVLTPYLISEAKALPRQFISLAQFLVGRLVGYLLIGAVAGWVGQIPIKVLLESALVMGIVECVLGLWMIGYGLIHIFPRWKFCIWAQPLLVKYPWPWLAGIITGLMICPPFLVAITQATQTGGAAGGIGYMAAFFVGTSIILLPLPLIGLSGRDQGFQWAGRLAALLVGTWLLVTGIIKF
jgi:sulfite exporter TauE/SafE